MIIVRIFGGLGNQMFQYSAGRALSCRLNVPLKLDLRWLSRYHTPFQLDKFGIVCEHPSAVECLRYTWFPFDQHPFFFYVKLVRFVNRTFYLEKSLRYDEKFNLLGAERFLFGYFQSEKYFADFEKVIRDDFSRNLDTSLYENEVISALMHENVTVMQFRRGDYVTNKAANTSIGLLPFDYYQRGLNHVRSTRGDGPLLIFSDDIEWCKANVTLPEAVFVQRRGGSPIDDMLLAARCHNFILANSTFSWWCAWLCRVEDKLVIAPKRWYRNQVLHEQSDDLIPLSWLRL